MKILGIDTVSRIGSLALVEDGQLLGEITIDTKLRHAANLVQALEGLLTGLAVDIAGIDAFAVDIGPGSFTGIRVGMAAAQGLAMPGGKSLWGICSLEVLCHRFIVESGSAGCPADTEYLIPFIDAKRGEVYAGCYRIDNQEIIQVREPYAAVLSDFLKELPEKSCLFGPDLGKFKDSLPGGEPAAGELYPRAVDVALLAESKIKRGITQKTFEPLYIYDKIVTQSKK